MRVTMMLSAMAFATVLGAAGSAFAQAPSGSTGNYAVCRGQAMAADLAGEARDNAIADCMRTPMAQSQDPAPSQYAACWSDAAGLSGEGLRLSLDHCMAQPTQSSAAPAPSSVAQAPDYATCRADAIKQDQDSGEALRVFLDACLNG